MGGSFALAFKKKFPKSKVWGYARSAASFKKLKRLALFDKVEMDLAEIAGASDLLVLALPVSVIITYLRKINPFLGGHTLVFDMGSTKDAIQHAAQKVLPHPHNFVGCHPLCGSEKSGASYADESLYRNTLCIITSPKKRKAAQTIARLWRSLGADVRWMNPREHDAVLSYVSHLPHAISFSLADKTPLEYYSYAPLSFRDITRVAHSPARLWADIFLTNQKNMVSALAQLIKALETFKALIKNNQRQKIITLIQKCNEKVKELDTSK